MPGLKITREIHAKVRKSLKTLSIPQAAKRHHLSLQSVSRIKRGGDSYIGYKRALADDHVSFKGLFSEPVTGTTLLEEPGSTKPGFLSRMRQRVSRR